MTLLEQTSHITSELGTVETKACANGFGVSVRLEGAVKVMLEGAEPLVARFGVGEVAKAMAVASA